MAFLQVQMQTCACPDVEHKLSLAALAVKRRDCMNISFCIFTGYPESCEKASGSIFRPNLLQSSTTKRETLLSPNFIWIVWHGGEKSYHSVTITLKKIARKRNIEIKEDPNSLFISPQNPHTVTTSFILEIAFCSQLQTMRHCCFRLSCSPSSDTGTY